MSSIRNCAALLATAMLCLSTVSAQEGGPPPLEPGDLIGSTGNAGNTLIDIDPDTAASSVRAGIGSEGPVTEIRFRSDGVLFATTGQGTSNLITIDPDTGAETVIGQHDFGAINGLAFIDGTLYGTFFNAGGPGGTRGAPVELVIIDQTDASLTTVGLINGFSPVRGLAWDADAEVLYAAGTPLVDGFSDQLLIIDPATADVTPVGPFGAAIGGMDFAPDGTLYAGTTGGPGGPQGGDWGGDAPSGDVGGAELLTVDLDTGAGSVVGTTSAPAISGLAFVPGAGGGPGEIPEATLVPTLGTAGLIILALVLSLIAVLVIRRKQSG